jgi:hypothetical protein
VVDGNARQPRRERGSTFEAQQVDERSLESLLDNVFGIFPTPCIAERKQKNRLPVAFDEGFKRHFISTLGGSDEFFVPS